MRLMMQGLTDAAFEQRSAPRMPAWRRWQRRGRRPAWRAHAAAIRRATSMGAGSAAPVQPALVGDLRHGDGRYQTAADHWFRANAPDDEHQAGISAIELGRRLGVSYRPRGICISACATP